MVVREIIWKITAIQGNLSSHGALTTYLKLVLFMKFFMLSRILCSIEFIGCKLNLHLQHESGKKSHEKSLRAFLSMIKPVISLLNQH